VRIGKIKRRSDSFDKILFIDESIFQNTRELNRHNCHFYLDISLFWIRHIDR